MASLRRSGAMTVSAQPATRRPNRVPLIIGGFLALLLLALLGGQWNGNNAPQHALAPAPAASSVAVIPVTGTMPATPGAGATIPPSSVTRRTPAASTHPPVAVPVGTSVVPSSPGTTRPGFGVATHLMWHDLSEATDELDRLHAAGLTTIRFDVGWRWLEPERKGKYDQAMLTKLDTILREIDARGLSPIITVIETPEWARPKGSGIFHPPTNRQDYADAMAMLAARYAHRPAMVWEIWNEPNIIEFWEGGPNAAQYADLLKRAYKAIKAADPDATVLGGSIVFNDLAYLRALYDNGVQGSFDALAHHPYAPGRAPDDRGDPGASFYSIEDMHALMASRGGGGKAIWITEFGWSLELISDDERAVYLQRAVELLGKWPYVRAFCIYTLRQDSGPEGALFGMIAPDGTPTSSWEAYIAVAGKR